MFNFFSEIRVIPVKLVPNITSVILEKGSNFDISCQALGKGLQSMSYINWYKVNETGQYKLDATFVQRKGTNLLDIEVLKLRNITKDFDGEYKCVRRIGTGPATSSSFRVIIEGL